MAARQTAAEKRALERGHELAIAAITRQPAPDVPQIEIGETAAGRVYVKNLKTYQQANEGWGPWIRRTVDMYREAQRLLEPDLAADLQATVNVIDDERAKRRPRKKADES